MKKEITLHIEGMHCQMCVKHVNDALKETEGVKKVKVSLERKSAEVVYDDAKTDAGRLSAAVTEAGYQVVEG